jgi:hypothetical protein
MLVDHEGKNKSYIDNYNVVQDDSYYTKIDTSRKKTTKLIDSEKLKEWIKNNEFKILLHWKNVVIVKKLLQKISELEKENEK